MIDDGIDPLCELVTVCNPYHGSYDAIGGYISRYDVPIGRLSTDSAAATHASGMPRGYHRVDFGMPEITLPQEMIDLGLDMWNKTLLFGRDKFYSVANTSARFQEGGWPYKAPDGSVWRMRGLIAAGYAKVYGEPLTAAGLSGAAPSVELASIAVTIVSPSIPCTSTGITEVNFSPKGGDKAALHIFGVGNGTNGSGNHLALVVVEASLSGGDETTPPSVTLTQTFGQTAASVYEYEYVGKEWGTNGNPPLQFPNWGNTTSQSPTTADEVLTEPQYQDQSGYAYVPYERADDLCTESYYVGLYSTLGPVMGAADKHHAYVRVLCFVGYNKNGERVVVDHVGEARSDAVVEVVSISDGLGKVYMRSHDYGATWALDNPIIQQKITSPVYVWKYIETQFENYGYRRNGVYVASATQKSVVNTYEFTHGAAGITVTPSQVIVTDIHPTITNGTPPDQNYSRYVYLQAQINSNAVGTFQHHPFSNTKGIDDYCDADYDGAWGEWDWSTNVFSEAPTPHPDTGVIQKKNMFFF